MEQLISLLQNNECVDLFALFLLKITVRCCSYYNSLKRGHLSLLCFYAVQDSFHVAGFSVSGRVLESSEVSFVLTLVKHIEDFTVVPYAVKILDC